MSSIRLKEFEEAHFPARRPWLLVVVLLIAVGIFLVRYRARLDRSEPEADTPETLLTTGENPSAKTVEPSTPPVQSAPEAQALEARALAAEEAGSWLEARRLYEECLGLELSTESRGKVEARLGRINVSLVLSPAEMPEKVTYVVERGDSLDRIAKRHGVSRRMVQRSNQIRDPDRIRPGDMLRIYTGRFLLQVSKSQNYLMVYANDRFFKRYIVSTGKFGKTPIGTFSVSDQIVEPIWWRPDGKEVPYGDPENILGTRWMAIRATGDTPDVKGYGIHGTWDESELGQAVSKGCVRMRNEDVEELFDMVPMGAPVVITE